MFHPVFRTVIISWLFGLFILPAGKFEAIAGSPDILPARQECLAYPNKIILARGQYNPQASLSLSPWICHSQSLGQECWLHLPADIVDWLPSANSDRVHSWWFATQQCTGAILFCYGNAVNLSHLYFQDETWQVFDSGYVVPDVAFKLLSQKKSPPEKAALFGETFAGGAGATELAVRSSGRAVVLVRTYSSLPEVMAISALVSNSFYNPGRIPTMKKSDHSDPWPGDFLQVLSAFLPPLPSTEEENPQYFNFWVSMFR